LSSAFFPATLMQGWFQWVAERNPFSWLVDALRNLVITGFNPGDAAVAIGLAAVMAAAMVALAAAALRGRLRDT